MTQENQSAEEIVHNIGASAKSAAQQLAQISSDQTNSALHTISQKLKASSAEIIKANNIDVEAGRQKNLTDALIDRLTLSEERIEAIAQSVLDIAALDNPVGQILETVERPNGLIIEKTSVPIGVLGMIYESRPNVTVDAAALCLKSANAVILRGGSESFHSSTVLHQLIQESLEENDIPAAAVSMMPSTDRALVGAMLRAHEHIDVIIPRGGKGLTGLVMREASMPVFAHLDGNCHIFVHHSADKDMALDVIKNAKLRRTGICGAMESLLIDEQLDKSISADIIQMLLDNGCTIVGDDTAQSINNAITSANDDDWATEYLDKKLSVKFVSDTDAAIHHINQYGSHHTDCIIASGEADIQKFLQQVDSAIVMHNTSTQFADGGEFGMGAEIGIGTGKLHARGPVGLKQLTTFKYVVRGTGQVRS
ncbi:MAG: glutamate-5-semialdehyde dehydrogenase [Pseudomonadota bacterium]